MSLLYILGAGGHSKVVRDAVDDTAFADVVFLVQNRYFDAATGTMTAETIKSLEDELQTPSGSFISAIGSIVGRRATFELAEQAGWTAQSIISRSAYLSARCEIGRGCYVGPRSVVNAAAAIGANCIINTGAIIEHDCLVGDHVNISPAATLCGNVKVGAGSLIGAGATVLPGLTIGEGCVIGAGAVVISDVEDQAKVIGVPACRKL